MKTICLALAFLLAAVANSATAHDHPSVHGMLVVGSHKVYLSHLPMFHAPHDYQLIWEVEFDAAPLKLYRESLSRNGEKVYTLVPETFVLPDMVAAPRPFRAQLYSGHFERGGRLLARQVTVQVKKVVYFQKLNPAGARPPQPQYLQFGNEQELFSAHIITTRPDYDEVSRVAPVKEQLYYETGDLE